MTGESLILFSTSFFFVPLLYADSQYGKNVFNHFFGDNRVISNPYM